MCKIIYEIDAIPPRSKVKPQKHNVNPEQNNDCQHFEYLLEMFSKEQWCKSAVDGYREFFADAIASTFSKLNNTAITKQTEK